MRTQDEIIKDIKTVLETRIAPSVAAHDGEIKFLSYEKGVVRVLLAGSCSGCAMSKLTLQRGVENTLKHYVPEVQAIIGEDDEKAAEQGYTPFLAKNAGMEEGPDGEKLVRHNPE